MNLAVRPTTANASKWIDTIELFLEKGRVGQKDLESLIGKLGFSESRIIGKFARCQLRAMYLKLHRNWPKPTVAEWEVLIPRWWISALQTVSPRIASSPAAQADFTFYTDAATSSRLMAAVAIEGDQLGFEAAAEASTSSVPPLWIRQFLATNEIFGMGLLPPVAFLWTRRAQLANKRITIYIDNSAALSALIRGGSLSPIDAALVAVSWHTSRKFNISVWIARVASAKNIADPTRLARIASQRAPDQKFRTLIQLLHLL